MNGRPTLNPVMLDLLVDWEESKASGGAMTLEELCAKCPDQLEELRRHVTRIARVESLFEQVDADGPPALPGFAQLEEIGRGGMGVVYKARDLQLDQIVAIKIPFRSQNGNALRRRFERETKILAKLRHQHIVQVRSAGYIEDSPYLVMDYVPGGNLAERMQEVAGEPKQAARLISQVARAVDHAHRAGIIHRDLKPGNILLSDEGEPLVSDFGVAAVLMGEPLQVATSVETPGDRTADQETRITNTAVVGTPAYLPPEAQSGAHSTIATSADVWSLGVILYQCLTGTLPFPVLEKGGRDYASSPPKPSSIRPGVPRALERIIERCLAKSPSRRYATVGALAEDLERCLRSVELKRRFKKAAFYGLPAALVLLVVAFIAWPPSPEVRHERAVRVLRDKLNETGTVELIGPSGSPKSHRVLTNQALATVGVVPKGNFYVDCTRPCLVELLQEVPGDRFLLTVEMRQMTTGMYADVGFYVGHSFFTNIPDPGHRFVLLRFADVGLSSVTLTGPPPEKKAGSNLHLRALRYDPHREPPFESAHLNSQWYPSHGFGPGPWRKLTLDVAPAAISAKFLNGPEVKALPYNLSASIASPKYPRGGLGIYVDNCKVEVRNCRVTVIRNP